MARFAEDAYNPNTTVSPQVQTPDDYLRTQANPNDFGAQKGQAFEALGKTLEGVGQETAQTGLYYQQIQNETTANEAVQGYAKYASDREMQLRQLQGANAVSALPQYQKDMQDQLNQMAQGIKSPAARLSFMTDARNFYDRSLYSAGLYVGDEARKGVIQSYQGKLKSIRDFTTLHYDDPQGVAKGIQDTVDSSLAIAHQLGISDPDAVHAFVSDNVGQLVDSAITMQMSQGTTLNDQLKSVKAAQQMFSQYERATIPGSPGVPVFNAQQADSLSQRLNGKEFQLQYRVDRQADVAAAHMAVSVHANLQNSIAMVEQGQVPQNIPSDAQIMAAYPRNPEAAEVLIEQAHSVRDMAHYTSIIPSATPEQIFNLREQAKPDPNKPDFAGQVRRYNAMNTVINQRQAALNKDPAGYTLLQHPEIQQQFAAAEQNPQLLGHYAESVHATQTTLGIPEYKQHLLPQGVAQQMASDISSNPQFSLDRMQQYQKKYGYLWPSVFHDISTIGGLPVQYQSVANLPSQDATVLSRVLQEKNTGKEIADVLPDVTSGSKTVKASVYIKNTLSTPGTPLYTYMNSLTQSGASPAQVAAFKDSVGSLAAGYAYYQGLSPDQAVKKAVKAFTGGTQFIGGARVPADKFSSVTQNASSTLSNLSLDKIQIPAGIGEGVGPSKEEYLDTLRATPTWVTSPKDDALWLMDIGGRFVRDQNGNPVSVPFNSAPIPYKSPETHTTISGF